MHMVRVHGVDLAVRIVGTGPPVLLVHGIPDTSALWEPTVRYLSGGYRCITLDLPEFGESRIVDDGAQMSVSSDRTFDWSLAARGELLAAALDKLGIVDPVALVAHDAGGTFAIPFIGAYPERTCAGLFCITSMHPDFTWHPFAELCRTPEVGERMMAGYNKDVFTAGVRAFSGDSLPDSHIAETFARVDERMKAAILTFYRSTNPQEFAPFQLAFLSAVAAKPLRVIWGELNPGADTGMAQKSFPTNDVLVYPQVGHWPMVEQPQRWLDDVGAWLDATHQRVT
jgi:pimeloyl-ACP methyl ester carboxylesterase